jgi:hypothetical protein
MEWENGPLINGGSDDGDIHQGLSHHLAHAIVRPPKLRLTGACASSWTVLGKRIVMKCSIDDPLCVSEFSFANVDGSMQILPSDIDQQAACSVYDFPDA